MKKFFEMWKESVGFDSNNKVQKKDLLVFGASASLTVLFCSTWLAIPFAVASILAYKKCIADDCNVEE